MTHAQPFDPPYLPWERMREFLAEHGLPVPGIVSRHPREGILVLEDIGDESLQSFLLARLRDEATHEALYAEAVDWIVRLQRRGTPVVAPSLPAYHFALDAIRLGRELEYFHEHFVVGLRSEDSCLRCGPGARRARGGGRAPGGSGALPPRLPLTQPDAPTSCAGGGRAPRDHRFPGCPPRSARLRPGLAPGGSVRRPHGRSAREDDGEVSRRHLSPRAGAGVRGGVCRGGGAAAAQGGRHLRRPADPVRGGSLPRLHPARAGAGPRHARAAAGASRSAASGRALGSSG